MPFLTFELIKKLYQGTGAPTYVLGLNGDPAALSSTELISIEKPREVIITFANSHDVTYLRGKLDLETV